MKYLSLSGTALLLTLVFTAPAHAYLDPGTGSMIIQIIIGSVLAVSYTVKVYWQKIKSFFKKKETTEE